MRVLQYVKAHIDVKLKFGPGDGVGTTPKILIYTDSNWAGEKVDRKSTGGYIVMMNGLPVTWQSKKQSTIALSSTEAEYYALGEAVREALFLRQWMEHYVSGTRDQVPILVKCDNQGAIQIADHTTNHQRTKHIDVQHFFVREHVHSKAVRIEYVETRLQLADILTKSVPKPRFAELKDMIYGRKTVPIKEGVENVMSTVQVYNDTERQLVNFVC
jgi:hypothetical protein